MKLINVNNLTCPRKVKGSSIYIITLPVKSGNNKDNNFNPNVLLIAFNWPNDSQVSSATAALQMETKITRKMHMVRGLILEDQVSNTSGRLMPQFN